MNIRIGEWIEYTIHLGIHIQTGLRLGQANVAFSNRVHIMEKKSANSLQARPEMRDVQRSSTGSFKNAPDSVEELQ
jgi:hypothetical protein